MKTRFITRHYDPAAAARLQSEGFSRPLAQVLAGRRIVGRSEMETGLAGLIPPTALPHAAKAASMLADALEKGESVAVVGDYDCDGATASTVAYKGLRLLGFRPEKVSWFIPDRMSMGYGLPPVVVDALTEKYGRPDIILTVDNGMGSVEGVARANQLGIRVIVTDHHLPGEYLPAAACIVNPNGPDSAGAPGNLAGVGVIFYVLIALRAELRARGAFAAGQQPKLSRLLDLVALGTVADVVPLDRNNRILVAQGLKRLRSGTGSAGLTALYTLANQNKRDISQISVRDLGFTLAPRINAAGRIANMEIGIQCLLAGEENAAELASQLEDINDQRKALERSMQEEALDSLSDADIEHRMSLVLSHPDWHQGLVGLVASRVKERTHRPVIAFAPTKNGLLRGSGRSIPGLHLRYCLSRIDTMFPGLILRYGGHALAAGLTIRGDGLEQFRDAFEKVVSENISPELLTEDVVVDGALAPEEISFGLIREIDSVVWGQSFEAPLFANEFDIVSQTPLRSGEHLKATVSTAGQHFDAIFFRRSTPLPDRVKLAYRLDMNEWKGRKSLQLMIENAEE